VDANSFLDASVRVPRGQVPVMVYSHGDRAWGGSNFRLARQFIRNGWIVVAPDHTGNTALDNILPRPFEFDVVRAYDVRATIDFMANLPSDHPLAGRVDTSRVLVVGHSYGGHTAWIVGGPALDLTAIEARCAPDCVEAELDAYRMFEPDPRVVGVVAMDGGIGTNVVADAGFADMIAPALFLSPANDAEDTALYNRSTAADVSWVQLDGACHESFTGTFNCDTLPLTTSLPVTHTYVIGFGIRHVLQSNDAALLSILDGTTEVDPTVTFSRHAP
jgi:predicted dienelactone hydrolase